MLPNDNMLTKGVWNGTIYRVDGTPREAFEVKNLVPEEGIHHYLDVLFNGTAQGLYYCGLKGDSGIPADNWTYANINSLFTEFVGYDETLRQAWTVDPASGKKVVNPTTMSFTTTADGSVVTGAMIVTSATKTVSGQAPADSGVLASVLNFGSAKSLDAGEILSLAYSMALSSA